MLKFRYFAGLAAFASLGFLGCGDEPPGTDVTLAAPERGFQLTTGVFPVIPSSEVQDCYYFQAPVAAAMDVHRLEVAQNPGSHHMNLFRFVGATSGHTDGEIQRGCWDAVAFETWDLVFNSQTFGVNDWTLPPGVSHHIEPGDMFMLQTHYVNAATQQTALGRGKVIINFYQAEPADAQYRLGSMFANNRGIRIEPQSDASFTTQCLVPQDATFVAAAGHFHSRGIEFDIGTITNANGDGYNQIYVSHSWNSPPWGTFDGVPVPGGGGLQYTCKFHNTTDQLILFGPHVEYQEHCNVFA